MTLRYIIWSSLSLDLSRSVTWNWIFFVLNITERLELTDRIYTPDILCKWISDSNPCVIKNLQCAISKGISNSSSPFNNFLLKVSASYHRCCTCLNRTTGVVGFRNTMQSWVCPQTDAKLKGFFQASNEPLFIRKPSRKFLWIVCGNDFFLFFFLDFFRGLHMYTSFHRWF